MAETPKRTECVVYEWIESVKHKYDQLAAPTIYHIKKQTKEITGVIVMDDASEKGIQHDGYKQLSVELVRDLMRHLAYLHTTSTQRLDHFATITELPPPYYTHLTAHYNEMVNFFEHHDVDHSRFVVSFLLN
ncbi:unnamed protein product [Cylicocyclus nassatus]|uniref:Uncharacterized protein n=1 Tax=Cylicocyclus nassatus TaxID=53992 RepID=A0AA36MAG0_CYLNA|nr:unnamed protein product [Cylicocyclus nassatus]